MAEECITPLRRRMIEDMSIGHFASKTQHDYIRSVMKLTRFLGRSPDTGGIDSPVASPMSPGFVVAGAESETIAIWLGLVQRTTCGE
jgi:hypothetical protein